MILRRIGKLFDPVIGTFLIACATLGVEGARILIAIYERRQKIKELEDENERLLKRAKEDKESKRTGNSVS